MGHGQTCRSPERCGKIGDIMSEKIPVDFKEQAETFKAQAKANHRFLSWEHCYYFFAENKESLKNGENVDLAALNLAFYLASWGMYRGSSFLLQYDYKIFVELIKALFNKEKGLDLLYTNPDWEQVYAAVGIIKNHFKPQNPTPTLITKILMGVFGCVPAFDRFFGEGYKISRNKSISFDEDGFKELKAIEKQLSKESWCKDIKSETNKEYPLMKIIDMIFWQYGFAHFFKGYKIDNKTNTITLYKKAPKKKENKEAYKPFDKFTTENIGEKDLDNYSIKEASNSKELSVKEDELKEILLHIIKRKKTTKSK